MQLQLNYWFDRSLFHIGKNGSNLPSFVRAVFHSEVFYCVTLWKPVQKSQLGKLS